MREDGKPGSAGPKRPTSPPGRRSAPGYGGPKPKAPEPLAPGLGARLAAEQAIADAMYERRALDDFFSAASLAPRLAGLDPRDRALARSIATVALRRLGTIRKALAARMERGLPKKSGGLEAALIAGAAQLLFMDAADHAAVDLAVRSVKRDPAAAPYAGLANAVLRGVGRERESILSASAPLDDDVPAWLAARWRKAYGEEGARRIAAALRDEPTIDLTVKSDAADWAARLDGLVLPTGSVRLLNHAPVTELDGFQAGQWWVQDAAAALPARLLRLAPGERVVDLCAAPGGKTAQLALAGAEVVALDRSAERLKRLAENLARLDLAAEARVGDAATYDAPPFDAVLLDAPCSATGTIRRHPDVAWTKRASDLPALAQTQARLLDAAARLTRPGGRLVYCVCSLEPEEGEEQIEALLRRNPDLRRDPIAAQELGVPPEAVTAAGDLRTLPHHLAGQTARASGLDGFYAARLRRA
jgi:16S rRNA (cytosine967-C5)-methyltransferase